ncbi:MAG: hypothetical protein LAO76_26940 [Acidobacteriia bacterium]|nr:hypothetical protein [Terriglobia bacterium]
MRQVPSLLILLLLAGSRAIAQAPLVTIDGGDSVDLCASCSKPQIRVAVTPTANFRPRENPSVSEVSLGALRDNSLRDAFTVKWEKGKQNYPIALLVDIDATKVTKAGTYNVVLNLLPKTQPDAPRLTLQVQHPTAQLQLPSKLIVYRILGCKDDKQALVMAEISGKSSITDVQVSPALQPSLLGNVPVTGQLHLIVPNKLEAGKPTNVDYELMGDFPLGTVTGAMQVTAPQLTQAVPLNFEVRSRLPLFMVFVYALAGALVSWLLKVLLQGRIELNQARINADDLLHRVKMDCDKHLDSTFRGAIDQAVNDLTTARAGESAADIEKYRQALDQIWRDELKKLATRHQDVQIIFDDLRSVTDNTWAVPKLVMSSVETGKRELDKAAVKLGNDDLAGAKQDLLSLQNNLGLQVKLGAIEWQQKMVNYFEFLQKSRGGISSVLKMNLQTALEKQQSALANIKDDTACATTANILQVLSTLTISVSHIRDPLSQLKTALVAEIEKTAKQMAKASDQQTIARLKKETLDFAATLQQVPDDPGTALDSLPTQLANLDQAWRHALLKQLGSKDTSAVEARLNVQDYAGAVNVTINAYSSSTFLSGTPPPGADAIWPSSLRSDFVVAPIPSYRTSAPALDLPREVDRTPVTPRKQLFWAKSIQSATLFFLVGLGGLMLYQSTFVGTFEDFSKIFFWAFGLDLTIDTLRQATRAKSA